MKRLVAKLVQDHVNNVVVRNCVSFVQLVVSTIGGIRSENCVMRLSKAWAYASVGPLQRLIRARIEKSRQVSNSGWSKCGVLKARYGVGPKKGNMLTRTIVVKEPKGNERGVMILYFEYNWFRLAWGIEDMKKFEQRWRIVLASSWSPTDYLLLGFMLDKLEGDIFVQACNHEEIEKLEQFHPRVRCSESLPCDWLNPKYFDRKQWSDREIDLLIVANWAPFKRHEYLFQILKYLPQNLSVVCVGQKQGTSDLLEIKRLAEQIGAPQDIQFRESIPIDEVNRLQSRSKIGFIGSNREGCCVAAAEALMAGCYLVVPITAHIGPKAYINTDSGALLNVSPKKAARQIENLLVKVPSGENGVEAPKEIYCEYTAARMNASLKALEIEAGRTWERDMIIPCWHPYPGFFTESDAELFRTCYLELEKDYPELFSVDLLETSVL